MLRSELLAVLSEGSEEVDGREVVALLHSLEELTRRAERTVTGRFVNVKHDKV